MSEGQVHVTDIGHWPAETWQPAVVKPFEGNYAHGLSVLEAVQPGVAPHPHFSRRIRKIAGKRLLVRLCPDPTVACPCGALQCEVEQTSAEAAMPDWGEYGKFRPTICSEMLYID